MLKTGKKRQRSTNFTTNETEHLVNEVLKRASVMENKNTDAITWKQKEKAWQDLTEVFNTLTAGNRTDKMLKAKYDAIKRTIKQKHNRMKTEIFKTGGGAAEVIAYTPWEEKLLRLISLSVEGLPSANDSDTVEKTSQEVFEIEHFKDDFEILGEVEVIPVGTASTSTVLLEKENIIQEDGETSKKDSNWDTWTPSTLKNPINKKLKTPLRKRDHANKYNDMAAARKDLIDLQRKVAEREMEKLDLEIANLHRDERRKEIEHQLRIKFATEEHNIKMNNVFGNNSKI